MLLQCIKTCYGDLTFTSDAFLPNTVNHWNNGVWDLPVTFKALKAVQNNDAGFQKHLRWTFLQNVCILDVWRSMLDFRSSILDVWLGSKCVCFFNSRCNLWEPRGAFWTLSVIFDGAFAWMVNGFQPWNIFAKSSISNILQGSALASEHISFKNNTNYHLVWEITRDNTISYKRKHQTAYELW